MTLNSEARRKRYLQAAEGYFTLGMPDHALEALKQVAPADNTDFEWLMLRGDILRVKQQHDQALACFQAAHSLRPKSLEVLLGMAWCFKRTGSLDRSIECMQQAYESHPDQPIVLYNLSCYYALDGQKPQALSWLGRAVRMDRSFYKLIDDETDFDSLRNDPDFRHLMELLTKD